MGTSLLTARQVQDLLDIDKSTVYRMAGDGRLPAVKVGRQWRFPADEIQRILHLGPPAPADREIDAGTAQAVIDLAARAAGVMMVVTDTEGNPLTEVANPCRRFAELSERPDSVAACVAEWRRLADDLDFAPRFEEGALGFECARTFVRSGNRLVGMVLAGGIAPAGGPSDGLYRLDGADRARVLEILQSVGALLSRCAVHTDEPRTGDGRVNARTA